MSEVNSAIKSLSALDVDAYEHCGRQEQWGQRPAVSYRFWEFGGRTTGQLIEGMYVSSGTDAVAVASEETLEPDDVALIDSGMLPKLLARALRDAGPCEWEAELDDI